VQALEIGANDYVTKPFGVAELMARIKVALRHTRAPQPQGVMTFGDLDVDTDARRAFVAGTEIHLTPLEYKLLFVMIHNPGKILTTRYLLKEVWGYDTDQQKHYVRILTAGLRKKIEPDALAQRLIHTESGVGYRFFS
jgi:two-component system KDP operon response regulator KdpE